jgi:hypothetical protein
MNVPNRPPRSSLSRDWLAHLDGLHDALLAKHADDPQTLALRFEITIAENELVRRGLPPHALELPDRSPTGLSADFAPRPWAAPEAQRLFGMALLKTGKKFNDEGLIRLGWALQKTARQQTRGE